MVWEKQLVPLSMFVLFDLVGFYSSRQVININSDGKVESPRSPRSPRSPKKSKSPTRIKTAVKKSSSPKSLLEPDDCVMESRQSENETSESKDLRTVNGPVSDNSSSSSDKSDDLKSSEIVR